MKNEVANNIKQHISFISCPDIQQICAPLLKHTPIKVFEYSRIYPDGSRLELSNHHAHLENAFISRAKMSRVYTPSLLPQTLPYLFITPWIENLKHPSQKTLREQLLSQHELFGIGNEFNIIKRKDKYVEIFHFYASHSATGLENVYLNNREIFERFALYFVNKARLLIQKADKDRIIKPWRNKLADKVIVTSTNAAINHQEFINAIKTRHFYFSVGSREIVITKREMDCAYLLLQGKTAREIAERLFLSMRTVEVHLDSLRTKTDCANRSELIAYLLSVGFAGMSIV